MIRVGLVGFGTIGRELFARMGKRGSPLEPAFVYSRTMRRLAGVPRRLILNDLTQVARREADLIVEAAHPEITRQFGVHLVAAANYLPLSVTALADTRLRNQLLKVAARHGKHVLLPHGALVGADSLFEWRHMWSRVVITFRKAPRNIDFSCCKGTVREIRKETVLYDGKARGIANLFPTNVNSMVTCALLTVGLDRCRARLIADPGLDKAILELEAHGKDGSHLMIRREQPAVGVSGTEMAESLYRSIVKAGGAFERLDVV